MAILTKHARPVVEFNPNNADHRRWLVSYINTGGWGQCPVRFYLEEESGYFVPQLQSMLLKYYAEQEFGAETNSAKTIDLKK